MGEKKRVSANEILADLRSGLDDNQLMAKYGLSAKQLEQVYRRLVETGKLTQAEVDARKGLLDDVLEFDEEYLEALPQAGKSSDYTEAGQKPLPSSPGPGDSLPPQPKSWQKKAFLGIVSGIILALLGGILPAFKIPGTADWLFTVLGPLMTLCGLGLQIWGCYFVVKGKGYHGALSLLGILSCLGFIILLILPSRYAEEKSSGLLIALIVGLVSIVAIAVLGIILAIAVPYYVSYKRVACDRAASEDVRKLAAAFEVLGKELGERKLNLDNNAITRVVEGNALQHMVGSYYGFRGCTAKCEVLMRINRDRDRWIIEGTALKGSRPQGGASRYVYRSLIGSDVDLPATIATDVASAQNGKSGDWNTYPYASPGQPETCYTESIIQEGAPGSSIFSLRTPNGVPCGKLDQK